MNKLREIKVTEIENLKIGQAEDAVRGTGCTVLLLGAQKSGAPAGLDVRGGGPASRESELLQPLAAAQSVNAIVLSGGSAFGLGAAGGVMRYLQERDIGYEVGPTVVPLVCQADLFDLTVADAFAYPDEAMGYAACENFGNYQDGNHGAGTGATVGKRLGMDFCMKSGIGSYAIQIGELKIGAVVAVNALGDVFDPATGKKVAGLLDETRAGFRSVEETMLSSYAVHENKFVGNTTIGAVITNAAFNKVQLCKIAGMAQNGMARAIDPVHTSADGDSLYAVSVGEVSADKDLVGYFAAHVVSKAILRAVESAESAYGFPALCDLPVLE